MTKPPSFPRGRLSQKGVPLRLLPRCGHHSLFRRPLFWNSDETRGCDAKNTHPLQHVVPFSQIRVPASTLVVTSSHDEARRDPIEESKEPGGMKGGKIECENRFHSTTEEKEKEKTPDGRKFTQKSNDPSPPGYGRVVESSTFSSSSAPWPLDRIRYTW